MITDSVAKCNPTMLDSGAKRYFGIYRLFEEYTPQTFLELLILGSINKRIHATVCEHGHDAEVIKGATKCGKVIHAQIKEEEEPLIPARAENERGAHNHQCLYYIPLRPGLHIRDRCILFGRSLVIHTRRNCIDHCCWCYLRQCENVKNLKVVF